VSACTGKVYYMANQSIGLEAGAVQSGNIAMLGALCAAGELPFGPEALEAAIKANLPAKIQAVNLKALELGVKALNS
jgi:indolepyruvate ferredoxin oxidoreductase beta subunit